MLHIASVARSSRLCLVGYQPSPALPGRILRAIELRRKVAGNVSDIICFVFFTTPEIVTDVAICLSLSHT